MGIQKPLIEGFVEPIKFVLDFLFTEKAGGPPGAGHVYDTREGTTTTPTITPTPTVVHTTTTQHLPLTAQQRFIGPSRPPPVTTQGARDEQEPGPGSTWVPPPPPPPPSYKPPRRGGPGKLI